MKHIKSIIAVAVVAACCVTAASAQTWNPQQTAVWQVVQKTWEMDQKQDGSWMTSMTHANVAGWGMQNPTPRNQQSMARWSKFDHENNKILMMELAPLSIATSEHAAVAHYYTTVVGQDHEGKRKTENGYCTDTLVKQGDAWVFLGWNCGTLPSK
jgi:hypothetical protein